MRIAVDTAARAYLSSRSGQATIYFPDIKVQCCVPCSVPEVKAGPPDAPGGYLPVENAGVTVYVPAESAPHQGDLTITLRGIGPFRGLALVGWRAFGEIRL